MTVNGHQKIELSTSITVRDLAQKIDASPIDIIKILMSNGVMANINQQIDFDTAAVVASELGYEATLYMPEEETASTEQASEVPLWRRLIEEESTKNLETRPPVVTILGHVDHGKTTLLDSIRDAHVAAGEAGGITQHVGAYQVTHNGRLITFLDTPGHAAFTAMRARGAKGADIVVLVVAANDGVMPQTREAIAHARAAQVPIIVALNKIDLADANPDYVKNQLAETGLIPDEWDGNTIIVPVSAKNKQGIMDLLVAILLVADSSDIKANQNGRVFGSVIEAEIDKAKGVIANLLVQNGTLQVGDVIVAGNSCGKIRAMFDFYGKKIRKAPPSTPVQVMGLNEVPSAGDLFTVSDSEKTARQEISERKNSLLASQTMSKKPTLEELFSRFQAGEIRELRLILKADVQGSLEPIMNSINELSSGEIKINILHATTGNITEGDVLLASASQAIVVGFNVDADTAARRLGELEGVNIRLYNIIYRLTEDLEKALKGMLAPEMKERVTGRADVLATFKVSKLGSIAGCRVSDGEIRRNANIRVLRNSKIIYTGELTSLKHEKDDVRDVRKGFECGIGLKNFSEFQVGDVLECYVMEQA